MDKHFDKLAKLVGEALAKRWTQIMARKPPREAHAPRRRPHKQPLPKSQADGQV